MKANQNGRECAPWCQVDHAEAESWRGCTGPDHGPDRAHAAASQSPYGNGPEVAAWTTGARGFYALFADNGQRAEWLASSLENLAGMRKSEIRALAANVRKAAAEAFPESEAEAS